MKKLCQHHRAHSTCPSCLVNVAAWASPALILRHPPIPEPGSKTPNKEESHAHCLVVPSQACLVLPPCWLPILGCSSSGGVRIT